ncbi:MAG: hypothetical protein B5M51_02685 [Anaerolinea sp. 4484_236]|nr:MAG: hypothetical protein B5M51_02685 [Anaerolinea sp. 4484_236]
MANRNSSRRRRKKDLKKKTAPPVGMIIVGVGIILLGIAALFIFPSDKNTKTSPSPEDEYSSIPLPVEYDAPELALTNLANEDQSLADYRGSVVMVNLWATWCPPCKAELPILQEYYKDHKDEGFVIIGIDSQESLKQVEGYIKTTTVKYPIWIDPKGAAGMAFNSFSLPASFVIDRDGVVRLAWTGAISKNMLEKHVTPLIQK